MEQRIGHYEIISELGRGGMGVVYKAHEQSLNRYVALKVLGEHLSEDPSYVQRFLREARSAAALNHPNIVQIYAVDEFEGKHFFAMEFVPGKSVLQMIRAQGKIEGVEAARLCLQAASGLAAAHEKDIIHRDIKPANLMVDERGLLKITDFGLALLAGGASRLTATGMFMGTPGYLSPEQCRDEDIDARTDIYSLGVTLFEMLTGSIPFKADSPLALLRQILEVEPPDVRDLNPDVPDGLRSILQKMMAKDRDQRYLAADQLVHDLQEWLESQGKSTAASVLPLTAAPAAAAAPTVVAALDTEATMQMPSGELRDASQNPTAAMAPPTIPPPPAAPLSPPPVQAITQASAAAEDRVAGFVAPATAPAMAVPPPPAFTPAAAASSPATATEKKSAMPIIIVAAILLFCALGAVAAWKTGALQKLQDRFSGEKTAAASLVSQGEQSPGLSSPEAGVGAAGVEISPEEDPMANEADMPTAVGGQTGKPASSLESGMQGESSGSGSSPGSAGGRGSVASSGSSSPGTVGAGSGSTPQTRQGRPEQATAAGSSRNMEHPIKAAEVPARQEPPLPPPVGHGVALVSVGEPLLVGSAIDYVQASLNTRGLEVFDASGIPGVREALESGGDLNPVLRPHAHWLVLISTESMGERPLEFMGRYETEYQARLQVQTIDLDHGAPIGPPIRKVLGYTRLNVERKVPELLRSDLRPIAKLMGEIGN